LQGVAKRPDVQVELLDGENVPLVADFGDETLWSPTDMSHILTQVSLHRDLRVVYDEMFGPEGAEIFFRPADDYGICGHPLRFAEIQLAANAHSEIALGLRMAQLNTSGVAHKLVLNPDRTTTWTLSPADDVVVLTSGSIS
jgi:hypothetical protein